MTKTCAIEDCESPHYSKGWCSKHYQRAKNHGDPLWEPYDTLRRPIASEKACNKCGVVKALSEFYSNKTTRDGRTTICKACRTEAYREDPAPHNSMSTRMRVYGVNREQYLAMLDAAGHVCQICKKPDNRLRKNGKPKALSVDHCHDTGKVRGILCSRCNTGMGYFNHDVALLAAAISYLSEVPVTDTMSEHGLSRTNDPGSQ